MEGSKDHLSTSSESTVDLTLDEPRADADMATGPVPVQRGAERKKGRRFNYEFLRSYCEEQGITLLQDYSNEKVNRNMLVEAKCLTPNCDCDVRKNFRQMVNVSGCYCDDCTSLNCRAKIEKTCLEKYGVMHPSQSKEIQGKKEETCLRNHGVRNPSQNAEIKARQEETCLENHGVRHPSQSKEIRGKAEETCLRNHGVRNPSQNAGIRARQEETCLENHGVRHPSQSKEIRAKAEETYLRNHGVRNPMQSKEIKARQEETCLKNHGVRNPSQNAELSEKSLKNCYKRKEYMFPSGRIEPTQGYEHHALNDLLFKEGVSEDDIYVARTDVPEIWYIDPSGVRRRYFIDCFVKSQNRTIEVKSYYTATVDPETTQLKLNAARDAGYKCELWVYNGKGERITVNII